MCSLRDFEIDRQEEELPDETIKNNLRILKGNLKRSKSRYAKILRESVGERPCTPSRQLQIQLIANPNLFWATNNDGKIVLSKQPIWWVIDHGSYISVVNSDKRAQHAQFNGVDKQLTAVTVEEVGNNQRFMLIPYSNDVVNIIPSQNTSTCVTHKELNVVVKFDENPPCALWKLIKRKS
ncbi:hypothetical protein C1646_666476 [Rhizophagus diaphanus]|nr:hypothetical protein C1646_666476 [Rhizophagus diaphanus] [Rhizophagus sp. MUCL 43196]